MRSMSSKADGIGLNTSYGDKWLGDPDYKPVMDELQRRRAIVYVHPSRPECCDTLMSYVPGSFTEYPQDTNRTVMSLLFSGTLHPHSRHPLDFLPWRRGRTAAGRTASSRWPKFRSGTPRRCCRTASISSCKRLFYETANAAYPPNMAALLKYVPISQVMFGTDYPYVTVEENVGDLLKAGLSAAELKAIDNENAMRLIPRLKA